VAKKRLFVIDLMAMAFRNYHAFGARPLTTAQGFPTSAIFGSASFIVKLIESEKPDFLIVATDSKAPTFRHKIFPNYKGNRGEMPEDLAKQIPIIYQFIEILKCPLLKEDGVEADDLIGSLVANHANEELECFIVSGDKDFMQLINDEVSLYTPKKGGEVALVNKDGVFQKFGCTPDQVIDILALTGDSSDNIPGVAGIGEKGAAKLIQTYGSLDSIYEHLEEIRNNSQRENLRVGKEMAYLSKQLVTIKTDCQLHLDWEHARFESDERLANPSLLEFFQQYEFRNLDQKIRQKLQSIGSAPTPPSAITHSKDYKVVRTKEDLADFYDAFSAASLFSFDTETTGLNVIHDQPVGYSFCAAPGKAWYLPISSKHLTDVSVEQIKEVIARLLSDPSKTKCAHNLKFDLQMSHNANIPVAPPFEDTMIAAFILDSSGRFGIDHLSQHYLGIEKIPTSQLIGSKGEIPIDDAPLELLGDYACEDADCCFQLNQLFQKKLQERKLLTVYKDVDVPLIPILAKMEQSGIYVDANVLHDISLTLDQRSKKLEQQIYELAGETFNISSPKQLQLILFEKLKLHESEGSRRLKKTKAGISTDQSVLEQLSSHPIASAILEYRQLTKLKNTYVDTLPQLIDPQTNRIHTSFRQTGTQTGRLSSSNPNLQNIPIRTDMGKEIRKAFCAQDENSFILSADYSQVELRILAHVSGDENLLAAFQSGEDIHRATAATMFAKSLDEVDSTDRARAKAINYGLIYGMGPQRLSRTTGVTTSEAKDFIDAYFGGFPRIRDFIEHAIASARETGYSITITGRQRKIDGLDDSGGLTAVNAKNMAVNSPIQGSAADLIKIAMIKIFKQMQEMNLKAKMLLQVHDELVFECPKSEVEELKTLVKDSMENAMALKVPLDVEIGYGSNWLEAH
jgi:DNA polymerase-1